MPSMLVLASLVFLMLIQVPVHAQSGRDEFDLEYGTSLKESGIGARASVQASGHQASRDVIRTSTGARYVTVLDGPHGRCEAGFGSRLRRRFNNRQGLLYYEYVLDTVNGELTPGSANGDGIVCLEPKEAVQHSGEAPPPPTVAEIQDAVPLPRFDIATSPIRRGLTGLATWFWCDAPTTESVTVSIRGYRVVAEAHAIEFEWLTGDGHSYFSDTCGEEPDPEGDGYGAAARHTYETKDFYALELRIGWSGSYTFSGHGRRRTGDLGGVTTVSSRRYPVSEVRAVLVD
jgi:hypothetical protein